MNSTEIGRLLEDEVANIYRQLDGTIKVDQNVSIMGVQVDVYVEFCSNDGIVSRYCIDAKNYKSFVNCDHVRKCINDFLMLRNRNKIDHGIVVAAKGFTKDAHAAAREAGINLIGIQDLRTKALDFDSYLNKWLENYQQDLTRVVKYLPLSGKTADDINIGLVEKYILKWLKEPGNHITLLGNYGTGKSTTLRHVMEVQAKRYLKDSENERIPIFVELKGFRQAPGSRQLITDILVNEFGININYKKFMDLNEKGKFLIILDGFDEMADRVLDGLPSEHFQELSNLATASGKVILSSRTHYFKDHEHMLDVHGQKTDLLRHIEGKNGFQIIFLNTLTEKNIIDYLKAFYKEKWETYKKIIKDTYDLTSLSQVPILLSMIVKTLPILRANGRKINRSAIYETFTEQWFQRENWRRGVHKLDRLYFCKQLALYFYINQENSVHWSQLPDLIRTYLSKKINSYSDLDIFDTDFRTSNFLARKEDSGQYSFVHKSFMEYFVARYFHDSIEESKFNGLDQLKDYVKSRVIYEFLIEMLDISDIEKLKRNIFNKDKGGYKNLITNRMEDLGTIYTSSDSVGNCAYLLIKKGINLDNAYIETANLSGLVLNTLSFIKTNLSGVNFKGCKLTKISFKGAILSYSIFEGVEFKEVDFTEALLDNANFLNCIFDTDTLETISRSRNWGTAKLEAEFRVKVQKAYEKASTTITYEVNLR